MNLKLFVRGVKNSQDLREYARDRIETRLDRFANRFLQASVRLEDLTGPGRNKMDKVCVIALKLRSGEIRIREVGSDFYAVIDVALDRVRAALSRQVGRVKRGIGEG